MDNFEQALTEDEREAYVQKFFDSVGEPNHEFWTCQRQAAAEDGRVVIGTRVYKAGVTYADVLKAGENDGVLIDWTLTEG